jgi:hypothetical protein
MGLEYMKDALLFFTDTHSMIGLLVRDWRKTTLLTSLDLCYGGDHARSYWRLAGDRPAMDRLQQQLAQSRRTFVSAICQIFSHNGLAIACVLTSA